MMMPPLGFFSVPLPKKKVANEFGVGSQLRFGIEVTAARPTDGSGATLDVVIVGAGGVAARRAGGGATGVSAEPLSRAGLTSAGAGESLSGDWDFALSVSSVLVSEASDSEPFAEDAFADFLAVEPDVVARSEPVLDFALLSLDEDPDFDARSDDVDRDELESDEPVSACATAGIATTAAPMPSANTDAPSQLAALKRPPASAVGAA